MIFRNSLKLFVNSFRHVWTILIYLSIFAVVIVGISLPFVLSLYDTIARAGLIELFGNVSDAVTSGAYVDIVDSVGVFFGALGALIARDFSFLSGSLVAVLLLTLVGRLVLGLYEIPLASVISSRLSANATINFVGRVFAELGPSLSYVVIKTVFTVLYDVICAALLALISVSLHQLGLDIVVPFVFMLMLIAMIALRCTLSACWVGEIVLVPARPRRAFVPSVGRMHGHFASMFSLYFVLTVTLFALNIFVALVTFCAGLVITIPMSLLWISIINMTAYYTFTGRRYYVDNAIFSPSVDS